jgi:hypothetical protein
MGARKYKLYCVKCGLPVEKYHMEMRMGPKGYRSYVVHDGPCPKVRKISLTPASPVRRGAKAGVR